MDGWMVDGWTDGWMDGLINQSINNMNSGCF